MTSISQTAPDQPLASEHALTWLDALLALVLGGLSLALYVRTLAPFVLGGDSAEFQVLAYQLGIAHTPGYPIYLLLAKPFTLLPIHDIAYRVSLFSAVMAAVAVAGVYLATRLLAGARLAAVFAALALAVSYTFWSQATIAEVYSSGAAFVTLVWIGLLAWYRTGGRRPLFLAGLCGGLSLGVHSTVALLAPAVLLFLWLNRARWHGAWRAAILGAVAGLLLYLLAFAAVDLRAPPANIFNAAYAPARSSWNLSQADVDSPIQRMIFIGSGAQWRGAMFADRDKLPRRLLEYARDIQRELAWPTLLLAVAGMALLFWRESSLGWLFLSALLLQWGFSFTYQISDYRVFYITGYLLLAMLAAYAAAGVAAGLARLPFAGARLVAATALLAIMALGVWPQLAPYLPAVRADRIAFLGDPGYLVDSQTEPVYQVSARVVDKLPPNAIVFVEWFQLYTYYYAAQVERDRFDLRFVEAAPHAARPGLPDSTIEFIGDNIGTHPILFARPWPEIEAAGYRLQGRDINFTRFYLVERR
jgi:hypothetical protein